MSHPETDDDFGIADFDDADFGESSNGHPDEIVLPLDPTDSGPSRMGTRGINQGQQQPIANAPAPVRNVTTTPSRPSNAKLSTTSGVAPTIPPGPMTVSNRQQRMQPPTNHSGQPQAGPHRPLPTNNQPQTSSDTHRSSSPGIPSQHFNPQLPYAQSLPNQVPQQIAAAGFYSARAAAQVNVDSNANAPAPVDLPKFDPYAESPSIRKTVGIDHRKTAPVKRGPTGSTVVAAASLIQEGASTHIKPPRDFVNPSSDIHRRIGAPGTSMQSPAGKGGTNASAYRPPSRRTADPNAAGGGAEGLAHATGLVKRAPLGDVSNMQLSSTDFGDESDTKRQRVTGPENCMPGQSSTI